MITIMTLNITEKSSVRHIAASLYNNYLSNEMFLSFVINIPFGLKRIKF